MSHFLQNLIDRHQEGGVHQGTSHIVQPRPKARFETDSGMSAFAQNDIDNGADLSQIIRSNKDTGLTLTHNEADIGPTETDPSKQSSLDTQVPTQHSSDKPGIQTDSGYRIDNLNQRLEELTLQFGRKSIDRETPIFRENEIETDQQIDREESNLTSDRKLNKQASDQIKMTEFAEQSNNQNFSLTNEFNQRIQTILQRLNSQKIQQAEEQRLAEPQHEYTLSNTGNIITTRSEQSPVMSETSLNSAGPALKKKKQGAESNSENSISQQAGALQTPTWLSEMQADLNQRFQEVNAKPETEPVVNVTIGRVEVRAVQTESVKPSKPKNKPSGVMSLDDYLKQRESRG